MCVVASQASPQLSVVTLPPCVKAGEVQSRVVATLRHFRSNYAVESNLFKVHITQES